MARRPNIIPSRKLNLALPSDLLTRLELLLWSDLEGRVPKNTYQRFFSARVREYFEHRPLDLGPYTGSLPGEHVISGPPQTLAALQRLLEGKVQS